MNNNQNLYDQMDPVAAAAAAQKAKDAEFMQNQIALAQLPAEQQINIRLANNVRKLSDQFQPDEGDSPEVAKAKATQKVMQSIGSIANDEERLREAAKQFYALGFYKQAEEADSRLLALQTAKAKLAEQKNKAGGEDIGTKTRMKLLQENYAGAPPAMLEEVLTGKANLSSLAGYTSWEPSITYNGVTARSGTPEAAQIVAAAKNDNKTASSTLTHKVTGETKSVSNGTNISVTATGGSGGSVAAQAANAKDASKDFKDGVEIGMKGFEDVKKIRVQAQRLTETSTALRNAKSPSEQAIAFADMKNALKDAAREGSNTSTREGMASDIGHSVFRRAADFGSTLGTGTPTQATMVEMIKLAEGMAAQSNKMETVMANNRIRSAISAGVPQAAITGIASTYGISDSMVAKMMAESGKGPGQNDTEFRAPLPEIKADEDNKTRDTNLKIKQLPAGSKVTWTASPNNPRLQSAYYLDSRGVKVYIGDGRQSTPGDR